jgi:ubiquinone/menaquinone biosynthesis C-methylase UbiE
VRRFGYVLDPLCLVCCALYATNRWLIKPHCPILFFHYWFNDILLIPCALPPLLLAHRWLGLRPADAMPTLGEIGCHLAGWSVLFEVIGPHIMRTTGDPWDMVAYAGGAVVAVFWWRGKWERRSTFDGLAPHYRWMERVLAGAKLQRCRVAFLDSIPEPRHALLVGEGNGRFLVELLRAFPKARCLCVDSSAEMLKRARAAVAAAELGAERIQFLQADLLEWTPPAREFDLMASHFVLDCFRLEQLEGVVERLASGAAPGAHWLLSDFREPPSGPAKWRARLILQAMYLFFRWAAGLPAVRLTPPDLLLARSGFVLRDRRIFEWGLLHSDLWERGKG